MLLLALAAAGLAQEARTWTDRAGRTFAAQLVACDGLRATLEVAGRGKTVVPLAALSADDLEFTRRWRSETRNAPLIDPACLPPWPAQAVAEDMAVQLVEEDAAARRFTWESSHFRITGDLRLPTGIVRDLAAVFEATRAVLLAAPLGLHAGAEREKYRVRLFADAPGYQAAGGAVATGGFFDGRQMLILLPNLGLRPGANALTTEHTKNLFVLKHEVTHQVLRSWGGWPVWLQEGFAECVASWPYTTGRYSLQNLDTAMHDYLLKWRRNPDRRALRLIAPPTLMSLSGDNWQARVNAQTAYDHYNSAALLTHYFLRHDGRGDSAGLAAYFDALRRGTPPAAAEAQHLLRGRTREQLTAELLKLARRLAIEVTIE
ncbi:MAG: hypothetical protein QOE70_1242 [Chthoniobacter sp.]|nr:hypothetical protein [Chthoniobacter sp.]